MAKNPLARLDLESIRQLARQWGRDLVRQQCGVDVTPEQLEDVTMAAVNGILDGTLEVAAEVDAQRFGAA
jgi:hypothetical protein